MFTIFGPSVQDEELEREKLEQLALLQELEEQKAQLEQMLLKCQQERQQPKVVVTHEEHQPESFPSDHEVSSTEGSDVGQVLITLSFHPVLIEQTGIGSNMMYLCVRFPAYALSRGRGSHQPNKRISASATGTKQVFFLCTSPLFRSVDGRRTWQATEHIE